jgi:hypothetical protein
MGGDGLAGLAAKRPDRFPAFVASLPMSDIDAAIAEARRTIDELGAASRRSSATSMSGPSIATRRRGYLA